jgi:tRNA U34 2-thiouridine synthase MnmA/TrmU
MLRVLLASISIFSLSVAASECPELSQALEQAVTQHIHEIRASEYCKARLIQSNQSISIVIYTAEGQCNSSTVQPAGSCSNNWVRYMAGVSKGSILAPVLVGGKGNFTDQKITITGNNVTISGVTLGEHDGLCCPTVPQTKSYKVTKNGFVEFFP